MENIKKKIFIEMELTSDQDWKIQDYLSNMDMYLEEAPKDFDVKSTIIYFEEKK